MPENIGHVIQIAGPAVDVQFAEGKLPPIYEALQGGERRLHRAQSHQRNSRSAAAPGRGPRALHRHGAYRRHGARHESHRPGRTDLCARGTRNAGARDERDWRARRSTGPDRIQRANADSPARPGVRRTGDQRRDVRDRREGYRSHPAVLERRQNWIVRRRGRGQDRRHHGIDQQRRQKSRRLFRVCRRGRAHARRQRLVAGNERSQA